MYYSEWYCNMALAIYLLAQALAKAPLVKMRVSLLFLAVVLAHATGTPGINEPWITQFLLFSNVSCSDCPTNQQPRSIAEIRCRLSDLVSVQHVDTFREIVPFRLLQSAKDFDDPANVRTRLLSQEVLALYADFNVSVVLAFDRPVPAWMGPTGSWCPLPPVNDTSGWATLKNNSAWAIARFVAWLAAPDGGALDPSWLHTHLLLEPWNEFDAVADASCTTPSPAASAARAADLQGGVAYALRSSGLTEASLPVLVAPSVSGAQEGWAPFVTAYYAAGGGGLPSIHWYGCSVAGLEAEVAALASVLPLQYAGSLVVGETGCALASERCPVGPTAGSEAEREAFLVGLVHSSVLHAACRSVLFWRVLELADDSPPLGCEAAYGVTAADDSDYGNAGAAFFRAIGGTGDSQLCNRTKGTRAGRGVPAR